MMIRITGVIMALGVFCVMAAASEEVEVSVSVPGMAIGAPGSVDDPGAALPSDGSISGQGEMSAQLKPVDKDSLEAEADVEGQDLQGDGEVLVVNNSNSQLSADISGYNLLINGSGNSVHGYGKAETVTISGDDNSLELVDGADLVVVKGDNNIIDSARDIAKIKDKGKNNRIN